jgi:hypothetical protein
MVATSVPQPPHTLCVKLRYLDRPRLTDSLAGTPTVATPRFTDERIGAVRRPPCRCHTDLMAAAAFRTPPSFAW